MSWNGSDQVSSTAAEGRRRTDNPRCASASDARPPRCASASYARSPRGRNPSIVPLFSTPIFYLLLLVLALLGAAYFFLRLAHQSSNPPNLQPSKHTSQIASVAPAVATNIPAPPPKPKPIDPNARPTKVGEVVNGYVLLPSGRLHKRTGVITNSIASRSKSWYDIFKHQCNNTIACYLTLKPGDLVVGNVNYCTGAFKRDFIESLKEPIFVASDDTPRIAELKRDVIAARQELKDAMDRGEDIEQIIQDTREEFRRFYEMKQSYRQMFFEMKKSCQTAEDVEDAFNACNKALAEKGIGPIRYGPITKRNLMREKKLNQMEKENAK